MALAKKLDAVLIFKDGRAILPYIASPVIAAVLIYLVGASSDAREFFNGLNKSPSPTRVTLAVALGLLATIFCFLVFRQQANSAYLYTSRVLTRAILTLVVSAGLASIFIWGLVAWPLAGMKSVEGFGYSFILATAGLSGMVKIFPNLDKLGLRPLPDYGSFREKLLQLISSLRNPERIEDVESVVKRLGDAEAELGKQGPLECQWGADDVVSVARKLNALKQGLTDFAKQTSDLASPIKRAHLVSALSGEKKEIYPGLFTYVEEVSNLWDRIREI